MGSGGGKGTKPPYLFCVKPPALQSRPSPPSHAQGAVCDGLRPLWLVPVCICNRDVGIRSDLPPPDPVF